MKIQTSRKAGFTLLEIMIIVAIIGFLAAIAIPNFMRARETAQSDTCISNLRQLDGAIQQWALEYNQSADSIVGLDDIQPYLGRIAGGQIPSCPARGDYDLTDVSSKPTCTIGSTVTIPHVLSL